MQTVATPKQLVGEYKLGLGKKGAADTIEMDANGVLRCTGGQMVVIGDDGTLYLTYGRKNFKGVPTVEGDRVTVIKWTRKSGEPTQWERISNQ